MIILFSYYNCTLFCFILLQIIGLEKRPNDQKVIIKVKQHIPYNPINQEICMKKFYSPKYSDFIDDDKLCIRLMGNRNLDSDY